MTKKQAIAILASGFDALAADTLGYDHPATEAALERDANEMGEIKRSAAKSGLICPAEEPKHKE